MAGVASLAALAIIAGAVRAAEHDGIAGVVTSQSTASAPVSTPGQATRLPSFADLAQRVTPAVVSINVSAEKTGGITLFGEQGQVLKRGHELAGVLAPMERRLLKVVSG